MITVVRAAVLAAAVSLGAALPAAAQQAASDPAATPPAAAQPAAPATEAPAAPATEPAPTAEAAPAAKAPDVEALVQNLKRDLESLTERARQGAQSVLSRESPYVISTDQLAAIAAGAVAGALVIDLLGGGGLATLAGAAIGGVAGHWLYTQPPAMPTMNHQAGG